MTPSKWGKLENPRLGVATRAKLMADLDTFPSAIMPKKIVLGLGEPYGGHFKGFLGNMGNKKCWGIFKNGVNGV